VSLRVFDFGVPCSGAKEMTTTTRRRREGSSSRRSCGAEEVVSERHQRVKISFRFEAEINVSRREMAENLSLQ
jgi:hypothetical protein